MNCYNVIGCIKGMKEGPGTIKKIVYAENKEQAREKYFLRVKSDVIVKKIELLDG